MEAQDAQAPAAGPGWLRLVSDCFGQATSAVRAHALRSSLSVLGIAMGVAAVIAVVMLVQGLSQTLLREFQGLGGGTFTVRSQARGDEPGAMRPGRLTAADLEQIRARVDDIQHLMPVVVVDGRVASDVRHAGKSASGQMLGTTASYQDVHRTYPAYGRFVTAEDDAARRRVVVLGDRMRRNLGMPADPSGRFVQLAGEWFKVVGAMEPRGEMFGESQDNFLVMPFGTAVSISGTQQPPEFVIGLTVRRIEDADAVRARVAVLLRQLHGLAPQQADDFTIETAESLQRSVDDIVRAVTLVVVGVVGVALLVGGVGIMNVMLMAVTERTREIGIAKALGAPRAYILLQFLMEAAVLAGAGGLAGVILGAAIGGLAALAMPVDVRPDLPGWVAGGAVLFCMCVGVTFGLLPARRAADLAPVAALRHD